MGKESGLTDKETTLTLLTDELAQLEAEISRLLATPPHVSCYAQSLYRRCGG